MIAINDTLGWIQYKKGNYLIAVGLLTEVVNKLPQSAEYRYHLGMALNGCRAEGTRQGRAAEGTAIVSCRSARPMPGRRRTPWPSCSLRGPLIGILSSPAA